MKKYSLVVVIVLIAGLLAVGFIHYGRNGGSDQKNVLLKGSVSNLDTSESTPEKTPSLVEGINGFAL